MASFQAKIGWKRLRKRKIKLFVSFRSAPTQPVRENSEKITNKFEKLKYPIMASFQAKIGWKMWRKRENKNYRSISFLPNA